MIYNFVSVKLQINIKRQGKLFLSKEFCSSYKVLVSLVKTFLPHHSHPSQGGCELTKGNYFVFSST